MVQDVLREEGLEVWPLLRVVWVGDLVELLEIEEEVMDFWRRVSSFFVLGRWSGGVRRVGGG